MVSTARIAGVLALGSLVVPWYFVYFQGFLSLDWTVFGFDIGLLPGYQGDFFNLTQYLPLDLVLSFLLLVVVLAGAILLIVKTDSPKIGASLLIAGIVI